MHLMVISNEYVEEKHRARYNEIDILTLDAGEVLWRFCWMFFEDTACSERFLELSLGIRESIPELYMPAS